MAFVPAIPVSLPITNARALNRRSVPAQLVPPTRRAWIRYTCCASTSPGSETTQPTASASSSHNITILPGDGIGPEIMGVTVDVLKAVGKRFNVTFNFNEADIGGVAIDKHAIPFPEETLRACEAADSVLLACIGGPKWDSFPREIRPESGLLALRSQLGLFANLRPAKVNRHLVEASTLRRDIVTGVDLMVVRELTGDVYFGRPSGYHVREDGSGQRVGYNNMIYTEEEVRRVAHVAFKVARARPHKNLVSVDKANVLDVSQLWRDVMNELAPDYSDVKLSHMYVDNAAMQLIRQPSQFDTIVTGNIFGDILSDAASMLTGSLGMLPSASLGAGGANGGPGVFEPVHGSAPDIAGMDKANPSACVLSAAMMLRYDLQLPHVADAVEDAVEQVLASGLRTGDIMSEGMKLVGCKEFGEALLQQVASKEAQTV